jgi:hypothetical protein
MTTCPLVKVQEWVEIYEATLVYFTVRIWINKRMSGAELSSRGCQYVVRGPPDATLFKP